MQQLKKHKKSCFFRCRIFGLVAAYSALLSSSYFERINDDDDDDVQFQRPLNTQLGLPKESTGKSPTANILLCLRHVSVNPAKFLVSKASCLEILTINPGGLLFRRHPDTRLFNIYCSSSLLSKCDTAQCFHAIFTSQTTSDDFLTRHFKKTRISHVFRNLKKTLHAVTQCYTLLEEVVRIN